jgi:predicted RNA-binding protein YlqC (UPF0109 family)
MAIQEAVKTIVESLVENPQDVQVTSEEFEENRLRINIQVNPQDRGRVIGRQGKTINALRTVIKAVGLKARQRINIKIIEEDGTVVSDDRDDRDDRDNSVEG